MNLEINVIVIEPTMKLGNPNYIVYTIKGQDKEGTFEIQQRYSNFVELRRQLSTQWPGCYIPSLPNKLYKGNLQNENIEERTLFLDYFMKQLMRLPHFWYSSEVQQFLYCNVSFIGITQYPPIGQLIERYSQTFTKLNYQSSDDRLTIKIDQFQLFIKNATPILQRFKHQLKTCTKVCQEQKEQMDIFIDFFMPEYEQIFIQAYASKDDLPFRNSIDKYSIIEQKQSSTSEEYQGLLNQIKLELHEYRVFEEILQQQQSFRQQYDSAREALTKQVAKVSSLQNGQLTIFEKFQDSNQLMKDGLERVKTLESQVRDTLVFIEILNKLVASEIDMFKEVRYTNYKDTIGKMAGMQIDKSKKNISFYQQILQHKNLL